MTTSTKAYIPVNKIRILTAGSLFDGHDVAINIMRRIIQRTGGEVIHLGHNRSVKEIVEAAIQEDVQGIAITSYQGGHMEFFKYTYDLLKEKDAGHIRVFGGGGGTILPEEIEELHEYGIERIYSPDDGRKMGLQGMINHLMQACDYTLPTFDPAGWQNLGINNPSILSRCITEAENQPDFEIPGFEKKRKNIWGVTGTGGAGKSSLVDEVVLRFLDHFPQKSLAILSVDPTRKKSGGALLGDRIRMNAISHPRVFMRSMATRQPHRSLGIAVGKTLEIFGVAGFDFIILETSGIGQSDTEVTNYADFSTYVMTPEFGAASQLEKIDMLDFADHVVINKADKPGSQDALRDVRKQFQRNHELWDENVETLPVYTAIASQFNDPGVNAFFTQLMSGFFPQAEPPATLIKSSRVNIIPPGRVRYLAEICETLKKYEAEVAQQRDIASDLYALSRTIDYLEKTGASDQIESIVEQKEKLFRALSEESQKILTNWKIKLAKYRKEFFEYQVRDRKISVANFATSLSHQKIPKIVLPSYRDWGDILRWNLQENVPGEFPFTAGVFPFKREAEDPTRMFAGEGGPERTNKRFHYLSRDMPAKRLSTAFDSVTLYGEDPDKRPDIYGKVGNSGVSICTVDDAKKLYSGFDLCDPGTSVSMTINGPSATVCAFFMNAAIDQQCEKYIREHQLESKVEERLHQIYDDRGLPRPHYAPPLPDGNDGLGLLLLGLSGDQVLDQETYHIIREKTLKTVRGTVQADILKEDQAQNTCIFSTEFSLKLMGDTQQYFVDHQVRNFYSVSISGYHIAEAGANPISQLAFTLSNGFTYVEYYLARGMHIDDFAPNLSFFFSNGIDPEYAVIGRVARRIWSKAIKIKYGGNERSQKLKYHIQTSGRSLHAQEIDFNDIRTTLQALYAIYDNCNSLHTNAYDEAITTPTEDSVRRAVAIQLIINKELGLAKNENPLQGAFIIEELTDLVEEAVLMEFENISARGGVLGAMETMYQRSKIQEESLYYETLKHSGEYPIIGVNTFLSSENSPTLIPGGVIRATKKEKEQQIDNLQKFLARNMDRSPKHISELKKAALEDKNLFQNLMEAVKYCSLGQITHALFEVGGKYRRNM
ncbi:MAG: methylmalonyl-CoA mutase family protein [Saprospiraceae bacterium]|nr:methylmalonyl-CoA mutase family protein [Saprospiraceae bacterium]